MVFARGLKRICDVCFYMTFAGLLGIFLDLGGNFILTLPIFAIVSFLSAFLAPRGMIKYISLLLMPTVFLIITPTVGSLVIFVPITIYLFWSMPTPDERVWQFDYQPAFKLFLKIYGSFLGLVLGFGLLANQMNAVIALFTGDSILFAAMFLTSAVMFMRLRRHDEAVQKQMRFNMVSAMPFVGMLFAAILASSNRVTSAVSALIRFIWFGIVLQIFDLIARLVLLLPDFVLNRLDAPESVAMTQPVEGGIEESTLYMDIPEDWRESIEVADGTWFTIFLIIVAIVVTIIIFKILSKKVGSPDVRDDGVEEERFALDDPEAKKKRRHRNENQIREIYRSFLALVKEKGMELKLHSTSSEIEEGVARKFNSKKSRELRDKYIQVRYREDTYTKDELKQVKGLYKEIKKEVESFS